MKSLLPFALDYASRYGWAVHPLNINKKPTTDNGFKDATTDEPTIREYFKNGAQIGVRTGVSSDVFLLDGDIDEVKGYDGPARIKELEAKYGPLPLTPRQRTGRGGDHYFFKHFDGAKNSTSQIAPGVDTRGEGGYVVVAPSRNKNGAYEWIVSPADAPVADAPQWLIDMVVKASPAAPKAKTADRPRKAKKGTVAEYIEQLRAAPNGSRNDTLNSVAFSIGKLIAQGAADRDEARTILLDAARDIGLDEREATSTIDSGMPAGEEEGALAPSALVMRKLDKLGYTFRLNLCDNVIEVNGAPLDDIIDAEITTRTWDANVKPQGLIRPAYTTAAAASGYHPVKDYLNGLEWDGADHIGTLSGYFDSSDAPITYPDGRIDALHAVYLKRWLIGAVAKALDRKQNVMLVMAGPQNIGKSYTARWLCSGIPDRFLEGPIRVDDKDSSVRLMSRFIWEVSELDATTRRSDVSALKDFITRDEVTVRKAFGRYDTIKPALASMIGTVNECAGFLADESGNRRFMVASITSINWDYTKMDVNQLWAQAVALYRAGEPWRLTAHEAKEQATRNQSYDVESALDGWIPRWFDLHAGDEETMTASDIIDHLRAKEIHLNGNERAQAMELSRILARHGVQKVRTGTWRGYRGIAPRDNPMTTKPPEVVTHSTAPQSPNDNHDNHDNLKPIEMDLNADDMSTVAAQMQNGTHANSDLPLYKEKDVIGCHVVIDALGCDKTNDDLFPEVVTEVDTPYRDIGKMNARKPNVNTRVDTYLGDDDAND